MADKSELLAKALQVATDSVRAGGGPFGAVLVTATGKEYVGTNRVTATNDPTAHAEIVAMRDACDAEATFDLSGAVLYSSCQPCPMCLSAALWARVSKIVYGATAEQAASAGFDDARFCAQLSGGLDSVTDLEIEHLNHPDANTPFDAWAKFAGRVEY